MGTPSHYKLSNLPARALRSLLFAPLLILLSVLVGTSFSLSSTAEARTYAAFSMDAATGKVYFARNADTLTYPASLTKMMTLYLLFEELEAKRVSLKTPLKVTAKAERQPASKLGLRRGQVINVETAIKALVIKSANDVAVTVAENLARSEVDFARRMTNRARALGMRNTTFRNASGLYHSKQKSTARDMAKLGEALIRDFPQYYKYFSEKSFQFNGQTIRTHNGLLKTFSGADGMKTGYIYASGFNIVTSAARNGKRVITVVLGGKTSKWRDRHVAKLMNRSFQDIAFAENNIPRPPFNPKNTKLVAMLDDAEHETDAPEDLTIGQGDAETEADMATDTADTVATEAPAPQYKSTQPEQQLALATPVTIQPIETPSTSWSVQVGAFSSRKSAVQAVNHALMLQTDASAKNARRTVQKINNGKTTLYRARLTHLSAGDANRTCQLLQRDSRPCMTINTR